MNSDRELTKVASCTKHENNLGLLIQAMKSLKNAYMNKIKEVDGI